MSDTRVALEATEVVMFGAQYSEKHGRWHGYFVYWSDEEQGHVCLCDYYDMMSWVELNPTSALRGMMQLVKNIEEGE